MIVIGGGAGGLVTAAGSARLGARVALIEKDRLGGECLWTGCVPSKALVRTAGAAHDERRAEDFGLPSSEPDFDFGRVMDSMRGVIERIQPHDDPERFRQMGVTVIKAEAELLAENRVRASDRELAARNIVIATGSRPVIPAIPGLSETGYLTHESILDLREQPQSLVILGAGPIGLEFAQIFRRLGTHVTVVELADRVLPREDREVAERLRAVMESEGVRFHLERRAVAAELAGGTRTLRLEAPDGTGTSVSADRILVATGMRPYTEGLGLERARVELDERGAIRVDRKMRTSASRVWAAGDVTGILFFTHVADYQARLIVRNMFFPLRGRADYTAVPWATYTDPILARVGLTEREARDRHGDRIGVYRFPFDELDRAMTDRAAEGLTKIVTDSRGRILGAHILGAHGDALIHEIALAMKTGTRIGTLSQMVHAYPTASEAIRRAADAYYADKLEGTWLGRLLRWWVQKR